MAMASGLGLAIGFRLHDHPPDQLSTGQAFQQAAADQLGSNPLGGAAEEGVR